MERVEKQKLKLKLKLVKIQYVNSNNINNRVVYIERSQINYNVNRDAKQIRLISRM